MEAEVDSAEFNPVLGRTRIEAKLEHPGEATPSREEVSSRLAAEHDLDESKIIEVSIHSSYGSDVSSASVLYGGEAELEEIEAEQDEESKEAGDEDQEEDSTAEVDYVDIVSGTVSEAKDALKELEDPDFEEALEAEKSGKDRKTLKQWLEGR